jgi:NAD(P)-dependent dehydrogenase (short-subunit alcohol dehydrogenase family)
MSTPDGPQRFHCEKCGWSGEQHECQEIHETSDTVDLYCPKCRTQLAILARPLQVRPSKLVGRSGDSVEMTKKLRRTALVTGANRGIGFEVCRHLAREGMKVILTARDAAAGEKSSAQLRQEDLEVSSLRMDVARRESVQEAAAALAKQGLHVDVLINNAGVLGDRGVLDTPPEEWEETLAINFFGVLWTCQAFIPAMVSAGYGRVVNISSDWGSFGVGLGGSAPYSVSKSALNVLTVKLSREVRGDVKVNAVCPGWVRTDMGGPSAPRSTEQAARSIVWAATLPKGGPTGGFFRDQKPLPW